MSVINKILVFILSISVTIGGLFTNATTSQIDSNISVDETIEQTVTVAPTATSTPVPTATNTPVPTATNTPVIASANTSVLKATNTPVPTATATPEPTATATPEPTATATPVPTATATPEPTATATPVPTSTATPEPTATATPVPTATNTPVPTATNTPVPTATNTPVPTATNTPVPTATIELVSEYINVLDLGCKYDGITDDSLVILQSSADKLYFPSGKILLNSAAVKFLFSKDIVGEGEIIISDMFMWKNLSKYTENNRINVSDFYNPYINSLCLPNELKPMNSYGHQNKNGWITGNACCQESITKNRSLTCWGQIYPVDDCTLSDDELITICIGKMAYYYYDGTLDEWVSLTEYSWKNAANEALNPRVWGFYDREYKSQGFISLNDGLVSKVEYEDYTAYTFNYGTIKNHVLHFGLDSHLLPENLEMPYVKGNFTVWVENSEYNNCFVANIGFDAYQDAIDGSFTKKGYEYCGSRYTAISEQETNICIGFVQGNYDLLR